MAEPGVGGEEYLHCAVDRFEEGEQGEKFAVLVFDDGQQLVVRSEDLPSEAAKGTLLRITFAVDEAETEARRQRIKSLQDELFSE